MFAVIATVLNSIAGLMQSNATRHVTWHRSLATQPWYIAGLLVDGCGWVCTVLALRHLPVYVVQAVQGGAIALTAIGARVIWGSSLRTIDRVAVGACVAGLVLVSASAGSGRPATTAWVSTAVLVPTCAALALLALRSSGRAFWWSMLTGLGIAVGGIATLAGSPTERPPPPIIRLSRGPDVGDRWRGGGVS